MKQFGKSLPKDQDALIELARQQDWNVSKTANSHWRLVSPRGHIVIASGTTSDANSVLDLRARLKRYGLKPGKVRPVKPAPPEPKLVVDKSMKQEEKIVEQEKVNVPSLPGEATVVATAKKTRNTTPGLRGGKLRDMLAEILRQHDFPAGMTVQQLEPMVQKQMGLEKMPRIQSTLMYYKDIFSRVGYGRYRLKELIGAPPVEKSAPTAPAPDEEDDEKVLIEFLVSLDKVAAVVKRHIELQKMLKQLQKLGTNK